MLHYNIKIADQPYFRNSEKISDKTVIIHFLNENNQPVKTETFALTDKQDVYFKIKSGSPLISIIVILKTFL